MVVVVLCLVEQGKQSLRDTVFGCLVVGGDVDGSDAVNSDGVGVGVGGVVAGQCGVFGGVLVDFVEGG